MKKFNWLFISAAILTVLGIIADISGVLGVDVDQKVTTRWLLIEVIFFGAIILVLSQMMYQMKQKLSELTNTRDGMIEQLRKDNIELSENIKIVTYQRELLQSAIQVIEIDRDRQFTDPELAHLIAISSTMKQYRDMLTKQDRLDILTSIINLACADKDFRREQQIAVQEIGERYQLDSNYVTALITNSINKIGNQKKQG
jgi:hypothetical protein